jgi:hypothetical protein
MVHSPGFLKVVNDTRPRVREMTVEEARARLKANPAAILMDVREDGEWQAGHAVQAIHLGRGILERDLEKRDPQSRHRDPDVLRRRLPIGAGGGCRATDGLSPGLLDHRGLQGDDDRRLADETIFLTRVS